MKYEEVADSIGIQAIFETQDDSVLIKIFCGGGVELRLPSGEDLEKVLANINGVPIYGCEECYDPQKAGKLREYIDDVLNDTYDEEKVYKIK